MKIPALLLAAAMVVPIFAAGTEGRVFQATGIKICEPTATTATVWTRLTREAERAPDDRPLPITHIFDRTTGNEIALKDNAAYPNGRPVITFPEGADLGSIRGAVAGTNGQTRVRHRAAGTSAWISTAWQAVEPDRDFTATFSLAALRPGTRYEVEVDGRRDANAAISTTVSGGFVTAPAPTANAGVTFCVMTCQQYEDRDRPDGFAIYPAMLTLRPDFFVNTGDAVYYDHGPVHALTIDLARYHWARVFGFPTLTEFHRQVASYFMKDDHDTLTDDCHPDGRTGDFAFGDGVRVFQEQTALAAPPYRTIRWGRHLQVWLVEGRDFRSTREQDRTHMPTIWGATQIAWLERTMAESDATFRVLITPTPMVGPDRPAKDDNYSNAGYSDEGGRIRAFLALQKNLLVITGDRHWQYVSIDPTNGFEEWSVGAASDAHAGGWAEDQPRAMHRFLRIKRGGFLSGGVNPAASGPTLTLRLHDTEGKVVFQSVKSAAK